MWQKNQATNRCTIHPIPTAIRGLSNADGTTVVTIIHSHGLTRELLTRIRSLCDAHLQLRTEEAGNKLVKTLEVTKVRGAEQTTGNIVSFEVEPGWGIRVIPLNKAKG